MPARLTGVRGLSVALATVVVVALAACGPADPTGSPDAPSIPLVTSAVAHDDQFTLTIEIAKGRYAPSEKIEVRTTYTFLGPEGRATASGSGSGLVIVALDQLDGPLHPGSSGDASCTPYELTRGLPNVVPYVKTGGWDGTDPNAGWYEAFFKDPELRLPAGTWRLIARLDASLQACSGDWHTLQAAVTFLVTG